MDGSMYIKLGPGLPWRQARELRPTVDKPTNSGIPKRQSFVPAGFG